MATEIKSIPGRRGILIPIDTLQQNELVDNAHVRRLSVSIGAEDQKESVVVWSGRAPNGDNIANGRHRISTVRLLGRREIIADVLDFPDLSAFHSAQITASAPHDHLQAARIPDLVRTIFKETAWVDKVDEVEAFRMPQTINQRRPSNELAKKGLPVEEQRELADWVIKQSDAWMLTPGRVASILKLANVVDPSLLSLVGTRPEGSPPIYRTNAS